MAVVNFKGALRSYLLADAAIIALVGQRIYSPVAPQGVTKPYLIIQKIGKQERLKTTTALSGVVMERWQIDAYSDDSDQCEALAKAVCDGLDLKYDENWSGYKIYLSEWENENNLSESEIEGSETMSNRIQQDFSIKRSYEKT